jgi:hypothetical protein
MPRTVSAAVIAASVGLLLAAVPLLGHHSEAAEYDATKPVKVTGVVKKVEWTNPHIWFYVEGKDEVSGTTAVWGFSGAAPISGEASPGFLKMATPSGEGIRRRTVDKNQPQGHLTDAVFTTSAEAQSVDPEGDFDMNICDRARVAGSSAAVLGVTP